MPFTDLPLDILQPILHDLSDRRDWHACSLVNKAFNKVVTPLLYMTLDSRIRLSKLYHPSATLINRPELAKYVRKVKETGAVHFAHRPLQPNITHETLQALALCTDLHSLVWTDDSPSASFIAYPTPFAINQDWPVQQSSTSDRDSTFVHPLLCFLRVIREIKAPLRELTIRSNSDLGSAVWSELPTWTGLCKISIWCMEGPPRVLQGWAGPELGKTLTELELGRCAGVPPTILISVISQLPLLQSLYLKGAPPSAVLTIFTLLPHLHTLDTEFINSGTGNMGRRWYRELHRGTNTNSSHELSTALQNTSTLPTLRNLTVRTSSIDTLVIHKLFPWIRALVVNPGLESLRLLTFTASGYTDIPRSFILDMARIHGSVDSSDPHRADHFKGLKKWIMGQAQMTLSDIECICKTFPELEELVCSVGVVMGDVESIVDAISSASNLNTLKLHVQWIPSQFPPSRYQPVSLFHPTLLGGNSGTRLLPDTDSELDSEDEDGDEGEEKSSVNAVPPRAAFSRLLSAYGFSGERGSNVGSNGGDQHHRPFSVDHARVMMLKEGSKLRVIVIGGVVYTGRWIWDKEKAEKIFEVECAGEEE